MSIGSLLVLLMMGVSVVVVVCRCMGDVMNGLFMWLGCIFCWLFGVGWVGFFEVGLVVCVDRIVLMKEICFVMVWLFFLFIFVSVIVCWFV